MLGFYLITTGISFGVYYLSTKAYGDYLKRKGYVDADGKRSNAELGFMMLSLGFKSLIPIYNIYTAAKIVWDGSKHFDDMAADDLQKGSIRIPTEEEKAESLKIEKKDDSIHYEDMTNDEKLAFLEKEREFLLQLKAQEASTEQYDDEVEKEKIRKYYTSSK